MSYVYFGVRISQKRSIGYRELAYTVRLCLDPPDMERMGWAEGDRLVIDHETGEIRKAVGWEYGPAITLGACSSGRAHFQSVEPGYFHQTEKRRHCRRAVCDPEKGTVTPGEVDDSLNKTTFEKRKGRKLKDGRKQTIWKPSKRMRDAVYVNRVQRGLRGTARDFRHVSDLTKTPHIREVSKGE